MLVYSKNLKSSVRITISSIEDIQNTISSSIDGFRLEAGNTSSDIANEISATNPSKISAEMVNVQKETLNKINSEINQISNSYNESLLSLVEVTEKLVKSLMTQEVQSNGIFLNSLMKQINI